MLLLHECDLARGGCRFEDVIKATPNDLLSQNIYTSLAVPLKQGSYRPTSMAILATFLANSAAADQSEVTCGSPSPKKTKRQSSFLSAAAAADLPAKPAARWSFVRAMCGDMQPGGRGATMPEDDVIDTDRLSIVLSTDGSGASPPPPPPASPPAPRT